MSEKKNQSNDVRERDEVRERLCAQVARLFAADGEATCNAPKGCNTATATVFAHLTIPEYAELSTACYHLDDFSIVAEPMRHGEATHLEHDDFVRVTIEGQIDYWDRMTVMRVLQEDESQLSDLAAALVFALMWRETRPREYFPSHKPDPLDGPLKEWYHSCHLHEAEEK